MEKACDGLHKQLAAMLHPTNDDDDPASTFIHIGSLTAVKYMNMNTDNDNTRNRGELVYGYKNDFLQSNV